MVNSLSVAFHTEQVSLCGLAGVRTGLLGYFLTSEGRPSCCCVQVNVACPTGQVRHLAGLLSSRAIMTANMRTILTLFPIHTLFALSATVKTQICGSCFTGTCLFVRRIIFL